MKVKLKTIDEKDYTTYMDQRPTEIYDLYDMRNDLPVPDAIQKAEILNESNHGKKVMINYPTVGMFNLNGKHGYTGSDGEKGKKAFLHGGTYAHPEKGYTVRIQMMSPMDYIERCFALFNSNGRQKVDTIEHLIAGREEDYDLDEVFGPLKGELFYCMIDYDHGGQEGLHRAIYALQQNIPEIPVIVIH